MKTLETTLLITLLLSMMGCPKQRQDNRSQMLLDSEASGKTVTIFHPKEAVRPAEPAPDFKELSKIMQHDIDAPQRLPSKEVVFVKQGERLAPSEKKQEIMK